MCTGVAFVKYQNRKSAATRGQGCPPVSTVGSGGGYVDAYYTNKFKKYPDEEAVYHVVDDCPSGSDIELEHQVLEFPPKSENRRPCKKCLGEIGGWLQKLPEDERPTWFRPA